MATDTRQTGADGVPQSGEMRFARTADSSIAWRELGPLDEDAAGEPLLLIMGLSASSRMCNSAVPFAKFTVTASSGTGTVQDNPLGAIIGAKSCTMFLNSESTDPTYRSSQTMAKVPVDSFPSSPT